MTAVQTPRKPWRRQARTAPIWARLLALVLFPLLVVGAISWHLASSQLGQERQAARIEALVHLTEVAGDLANQVVVEEYVKYGELKMPGITSLPSIAPLVSKTVRVGQGALDAELHTVLARKDLRPLWWVAGALRQARALASRPEVGANQILDAYGALVDRIGAVAEQATGTMTADGVGTSGALAIVRDVRAFNQMNTTSADVGDLSGLMILYEGTDPVGRPAVDKEIFGAVSVFRSDVASLRASGSPAIWRIWEKTLADESDAVVAVTLSFANSAFSALSLPGLQVVGAPDLASLIRLAQTSLPVEQSVRTTEQQAGSLITAAAEQMARTAQANLDANIGLLGLLVIATFAFTVLLYRGVRDPMRDIAGRARRFSEGDFSIPGRVRLPAEVAEVSAALDDAIRNFDQLKSQADALAAGELSNPALKQAVPGKLGTSLFHSVTRVRELQQRLLHEARHDALTGLYNRRAAIEALAVSLEEVESPAEVGVMFIDLDGFKQVNDLYGHRAGDEVLTITAERLQAGVRPSDLVCRLGGDEFVVLVSPGTTLEQSVKMAARLLRALGVPIKTAAATIRVGASAGIAVSNPAFPATTSELLAQADAAVYRAKSDGRGGVRVFDEQMRLDRNADHQMAAQLLGSLRTGEDLHLVYQPIITLPEGRCRGLEALCRWDRPGHGPVAPDTFIRVAEHSDTIIELDRWVLDHACRQLAMWRADPDAGAITLHVNISGRHLGRGILVPDVMSALRAHGVPAWMLLIELTETSVVKHPDLARDELNELRSNGVKTALDDFGTGYTSIAQLGGVAIDILKIDRSLLVSEDGHPDRGPVIGLVVDVAHRMGMTVVAEGVEVGPHLQLLSSLGCDMAQGYYVARPMPGEDVPDWLRSGTGRAISSRLSSV